jgi:hypothetical protein
MDALKRPLSLLLTLLVAASGALGLSQPAACQEPTHAVISPTSGSGSGSSHDGDVCHLGRGKGATPMPVTAPTRPQPVYLVLVPGPAPLAANVKPQPCLIPRYADPPVPLFIQTKTILL